jgi:restriction system protein
LKEVGEELEGVSSARRTVRTFDPLQFKQLIRILFEQEGFGVEEIGDAIPSGGLDLVARHPNVTFGIQCRHWMEIITEDQVRAYVENLERNQLSHGFVVSLEGFAEDAIALARGRGIDLMDEPMLMQNLETVGWPFSSAFESLWSNDANGCPQCGSETILRVALKPAYGGLQIWGCSTYPRCNFKVQKA